MAELPLYLHSPGHAISARRRWENRVREEMAYVVLTNERKQWRTVVNQIVREVEYVPEWAKQDLLLADPSPDEREETVDKLARTIATASYNHHVLQRLSDERVPLKMWVTRRDKKVRETHHLADGQKVPLSGTFTVGGYHLQFPADGKTAPMDIWIGCRCVVLGRFR